MSYSEVAQVQTRLTRMGNGITWMEQAVLVEMANALRRGTRIYSWGHERLALAIRKIPGTVAAKQALYGRLIPSLIRKGLIRRTHKAHRGARAEYEILIIEVIHSPASDPDGMGNGQSVTPPHSFTSPLTADAGRQRKRWKTGDPIPAGTTRRVIDALTATGHAGFTGQVLTHLRQMPSWTQVADHVRRWCGAQEQARTGPATKAHALVGIDDEAWAVALRDVEGASRW